MERKRLSLILGAGLIAAFAIYLVTDDDETTPEPEIVEEMGLEEPPPSTPEPASAQTVEKKIETKNTPPPTTALFIEKLNGLHIPTTPQYNAEVAVDPEGVAPSVLASAVQMDEALEALKTEADGELFLKKMQSCAQEDDLPPTAVNTNCLSHARRLIVQFPQLKPQLDTLLTAASKEALRLEALTNNENGEQENLLNK